MKPILAPFTGVQPQIELLGAMLNGYRSTGTLLASAARTATTTSALTLDTTGYDTITLMLSITAASGTGGLTLRLEMQDPVSGIWMGLGADTTARTTTNQLGFQFGPGSPGTQTGISTFSTLFKQCAFTGPIRVTVAHGDASSYTYAVTYSLAKTPR